MFSADKEVIYIATRSVLSPVGGVAKAFARSLLNLPVISLQMYGSAMASSISNNSQPGTLHNSTEMSGKVYVFTPAGFDTKLTIVAMMVIIGVVGLVGNILIRYFVSKKRSVSFLQSSPFVRNFNLYIKSLTLSDILSTVISLPLISVQIMFDVFQQDWPCRVVRYFGILFPSITMNNFIVISFERFLSTRDFPRTFSVYTVRKLVYGAWIVGFLVVLVPASTIKGIRYDLNATHYTVVCKYDTSYLPFRVIMVSYAIVQHLIPSVVVSCFNILVAKTVWNRHNRRINIQRDNAIRAQARASRIRGSYVLVLMAFSFIIPYSSLLYYAAYLMITKTFVDFQTDFKIRYISAGLFFSSSAMNVIIYLVQMKDFRAFLKNLLMGKGNALNPNPGGEGIQLQAFVIPNNNPPQEAERFFTDCHARV